MNSDHISSVFTGFNTTHNANTCHGTLNHDGWVVTSDTAVTDRSGLAAQPLKYLITRQNANIPNKDQYAHMYTTNKFD